MNFFFVVVYFLSFGYVLMQLSLFQCERLLLIYYAADINFLEQTTAMMYLCINFHFYHFYKLINTLLTCHTHTSAKSATCVKNSL